jgi:hypothetical protein
MQLFPGAALRWKQDHGRAEGLLLAGRGRQPRGQAKGIVEEGDTEEAVETQTAGLPSW